MLANVERQYGISKESDDEDLRLSNLIRGCHDKYGRKVVVLVDEYDAPLLDVLNDEVKIGKSSDFAIDQINLKNHGERFLIQGKPIVKVGVNFDSEETHNITDWQILE